MKNTHFNSTKKGFVLSLVLWISAAMMLLALLFVKFSKEELGIYKNLHRKLNVELKTDSLFEKLSFYLSTGTTQKNYMANNVEKFPSRILLDNTLYTIKDKDDNITCTYSLLDHSALFKLRHLHFPKQLQTMIDRYSATKYPFSDLYMDWIDSDNFSRVNGAEQSDYLLNGYHYTPANYSSFQHASAICLLKDFCNLDKNTTDLVLNHISSYGYQSLNISLIDKIILKSIFPDMSKEEIEGIIKTRDEDFEAYKKKFAFLPYDDYGTSPSRIISISMECHDQNVSAKLNVIADFRAFKNRSWTIFEMNKF